MSIERETLSRTAKIHLDEGTALDLGQLEEITKGFVLQVAVGTRVGESLTRQASLMTVLNAGPRAFEGGVQMTVAEDPVLTLPWCRGLRLSEAAAPYGVEILTDLGEERPTITLGEGASAPGSVVIHPTWEGWSGGVVETAGERLDEASEFVPAGVLAGALAVAEAFAHRRGLATAGHRSTGLSLWRPDLDWNTAEAAGPGGPLYLPRSVWLLGLGHLGQAYGWVLGCLPYPDPSAVRVMLQDFDVVEPANWSTGLLTRKADRGRLKTRVVADALEQLAFETRICERHFDAATRCAADDPEEPVLAFGGFDGSLPRRSLERPGFELVIDAGLGRGPASFDDIALHSFPSGLRAEDCFHAPAPKVADISGPAYEALLRERKASGQSEADARCGIIELAGTSVAAAFVGAAAASLVLAEALRALLGGPRHEVIDLSLRNLEHRRVSSMANAVAPERLLYEVAGD